VQKASLGVPNHPFWVQVGRTVPSVYPVYHPSTARNGAARRKDRGGGE
jgi:hypothetical protein